MIKQNTQFSFEKVGQWITLGTKKKLTFLLAAFPSANYYLENKRKFFFKWIAFRANNRAFCFYYGITKYD